MTHCLHLRHAVIRASIPSGATRVQDTNSYGRWVCVEDCDGFTKDSRATGYGLVHSAKNLPEGIKYRCRAIEIELKDGRWISTKTGRPTNPAYNET